MFGAKDEQKFDFQSHSSSKNSKIHPWPPPSCLILDSTKIITMENEDIALSWKCVCMPLGSTAYKINENGLNKMMRNRKININKFIMRGKEHTKKKFPLFSAHFPVYISGTYRICELSWKYGTDGGIKFFFFFILYAPFDMPHITASCGRLS